MKDIFKRGKSRIVPIVTAAAVLLIGCGLGKTQSAQEEYQDQKTSIGVSVYNLADTEVRAFRDYFENYLGEAFDVDFQYSGGIIETEEELAFIDELHEAGIDGIISFLSTDLDIVLERCDSYGMYYMRGSGTISDKEFQTAKKHGSFLGIIGPSEAAEVQAGRDMAEFFLEKDIPGTAVYIILSGGAAVGNEMQAFRCEGMLTALQEQYGFDYPQKIEELARTSETTKVEDGKKQASVVIVPGYLRDGKVSEELGFLLGGGEQEIVMSTLGVEPGLKDREAAEKASGRNILVGSVDCFTEENHKWFHTKDPTGDNMLDYLIGKYGATVGPAFAAMYNALNGDEDLLKVNGEPFRLEQAFWTADSQASFDEQYDSSVNMYDNTYSVKSLQSVIRKINPEAEFEDLKELTEQQGQSK